MRRARRAILPLMMSLACACGGQRPGSGRDAPDAGAAAAYTLEYSDVMEFVRGVESSYRIAGAFASGEEPRLTIDGLPEGARFEGEILTWLPPCALRPETGHFLRGYQIYRLRINLQGVRSDNLVQKPAIVALHMRGEEAACAD